MKFKVWDSGNNEWANDFTLASNGELLCDGGTTLFLKHNFHLVPCIGLTDKHGDDIYYKDLLRHHHTQEVYIIEKIEEAARFAIRKLGLNTEAGYMLVQDNMHMFTVIGNEYESKV